jgi:4a-hydroxytetrahydrobiopterin dehydratase
MVTGLTPVEIRQHLAELPGWGLGDGNTIRKSFTFKSFPEAVSFAVRVAFQAEAADHHPDIPISYKQVTLAFTTHSAGGLTVKDFDGARDANRISWVG